MLRLFVLIKRKLGFCTFQNAVKGLNKAVIKLDQVAQDQALEAENLNKAAKQAEARAKVASAEADKAAKVRNNVANLLNPE